MSTKKETIERVKKVLEVINSLIAEEKFIDANFFLGKIKKFTMEKKIIELEDEILKSYNNCKLKANASRNN